MIPDSAAAWVRANGQSPGHLEAGGQSLLTRLPPRVKGAQPGAWNSRCSGNIPVRLTTEAEGPSPGEWYDGWCPLHTSVQSLALSAVIHTLILPSC